MFGLAVLSKNGFGEVTDQKDGAAGEAIALLRQPQTAREFGLSWFCFFGTAFDRRSGDGSTFGCREI